MKKKRLPEILKGLLLCAVVAVVGTALLCIAGIVLLMARGLLLTPIIRLIPH